MTNRPKHRIALIGLGMAHKPHLAALRELSGRVEIAACYAPSAERRAAFAADNPDLRVTGSLDVIMADDTIDTVLVLAPPRAHLALIERCARAGKSVIVEKPVEVSLARARQAVEAMEKHGGTLAVMLQHRFRPSSLHLAALMEEGRLGRLLSASAQIRWWRGPDYYAPDPSGPARGTLARDGGGVLLTQAIHTLDLLLQLAGPAARVSALARTSPLRSVDTEDIAAAAVAFANGAVGTIDATTVAYPGFPERIELACEEATAVLAADALDIFWKSGRTERHEGAQGGGGGADPMAFSHAAHGALIAETLDAIDAKRTPRANARSALAVHALIEAILASSAQGIAVAVLPA